MAQSKSISGKQYTVVDALKEMYAGWKVIEAKAKAQFPNATEEELYQICKGAMNHALGLK